LQQKASNLKERNMKMKIHIIAFKIYINLQ